MTTADDLKEIVNSFGPPMTTDLLADWILDAAGVKKGRREHMKKIIIRAMNEYEEWRPEILGLKETND